MKTINSTRTPPPGCPKSPLLKVQSAFWAILAGVELTEGVLFGQAPPIIQRGKRIDPILAPLLLGYILSIFAL